MKKEMKNKNSVSENTMQSNNNQKILTTTNKTSMEGY